MKTVVTRRNTVAPIDPRLFFGVAWVASFLGLVLIIAAVFWAIVALP